MVITVIVIITMCGEVTSPSSSSRVDSLCASLESAVVSAHLLLQSKTRTTCGCDPGCPLWMVVVVTGGSTCLSTTMWPFDSNGSMGYGDSSGSSSIVVEYHLQTMAIIRMAAIQWILGTHLTYNRQGRFFLQCL